LICVIKVYNTWFIVIYNGRILKEIIINLLNVIVY
jgi:hypothetical protein